MLANKYDKLKKAVKSLPDNYKEDFLEGLEDYNRCVIKFNKMEKIQQEREQFFQRVKVDIDKFLLHELYGKNGWYITSPNNFENYEDHIIVRCKYIFNTMLSIPLTLENLNKANNLKRRTWDNLDFDIYIINKRLKENTLFSWFAIPVADSVDYSSSVSNENRFQVNLVFKFKV